MSIESQASVSAGVTTDWMTSAECRNMMPDAWYSDDEEEQKLAIEVCQRCNTKQECLQYALEHNEQGIWGGLTEKWRRIIGTRTSEHSGCRHGHSPDRMKIRRSGVRVCLECHRLRMAERQRSKLSS